MDFQKEALVKPIILSVYSFNMYTNTKLNTTLGIFLMIYIVYY